jgi:hypothetical protein
LDLGPWTLDFGLWTLNRRRRPGVSIIEVLFAIMVTTVGLFGAIALFPVASAQAKRARLNDMLAVAGRSAFHDFDARGMRRPDRWLAWDPFANSGNGGFVSTLGTSNLQTAEAFCIDPRMIAAHTSVTNKIGGNTVTPYFPYLHAQQTPTSQPGGACVQYFPYQEPFVDNGTCVFDPADKIVSDLNNNGVHDPVPYVTSGQMLNNNSPQRSFDSTFMRRISLWSGVTDSFGNKLPMTLPQANAIFTIDDDLSYQRPTGDKSKPAGQNPFILPFGPTDLAGIPNAWGKRQNDGKISWIATLVPQFDQSGAASDQYVLSVVMIYERNNDLDILDNKRERAMFGTWQSSTAATGGEIYLTANDPDQLKLRPNDWVMVSGSYNVPNLNKIVTRFQWYRVAECDAEPAQTSSGYELYATLMGQDWNTSFSAPLAASTVRVTIVEGAFAVYEKTVRLEYGSTF